MPKYEVGRYEVEITGQGFQEAKTGTMQLVLEFKVLGKVDPRDPNSLISVAPGERKLYRAITENTVEWVMDDLKRLGVENLTSWAQLDPQTDGYIDLAGKTLDMMCGAKNGTDGKSYEDWSIAGGSTSKPIENAAPTKVKALDRLFGKHLKKNGAAPGRTQQRGPVPVAAQATTGGGVITDDDVPF